MYLHIGCESYDDSNEDIDDYCDLSVSSVPGTIQPILLLVTHRGNIFFAILIAGR